MKSTGQSMVRPEEMVNFRLHKQNLRFGFTVSALCCYGFLSESVPLCTSRFFQLKCNIVHPVQTIHQVIGLKNFFELLQKELFVKNITHVILTKGPLHFDTVYVLFVCMPFFFSKSIKK